MVSITIKADLGRLANFSGQIADIKRRMEKPRPLLERIRDDLREQTDVRFRKSGAHEGSRRWKPLTAQYGRRKMKKYGGFKTILTASGEMRRSLTKKTARFAVGRIKGNTLLWGSRLMVGHGQHNLSEIHDEGQGTQPKRRIFVVPKRQRERWAKFAEEWVTKAIGVRGVKATAYMGVRVLKPLT